MFPNFTRSRRPSSPTLEILEARVAPASVTLPNGAGPFTLEVDAAENHLHIVDGVGVEIFDQGGAVGDDLTITGGTSADLLTIHRSAAGDLTFTGALDVNVAGPINIDGGLSTGTGLTLTSIGTIALTGANADLVASGGPVTLNAGRNITAAPGSSISVVNGDLTLIANASGTTAGTFIGIQLEGAVLTTTGTGNISLLGHGGMNATASGQSGISIYNDAMILSTMAGAGAGTITVTGAGAIGDLGTPGVGGNEGVTIGNFGGGSTQTGISSVSGAILIIGTGGVGTEEGQIGIDLLDGVRVESTGTGANAATITMNGTGSDDDAGYSVGISVAHSPDGIFGSRVTSVDGNISMTGVGGAGGTVNQGLVLYEGGRVAATGSASIFLTGSGGGTGPDNSGIVIGHSDDSLPDSQVTAVDGSITFTGTAGPDGAGRTSFGAVNVGGVFQTTGLGDINFIGDSISLNGVIDAGTHAVTFKPKTPGAPINFGGQTSTDPAQPALGIGDLEFQFITAGTLKLGDSTTGTVSLSRAITVPFNLELTSGGDVVIHDELNLPGNKALTIHAGHDIDLDDGDSDVQVSGTGTASAELHAQATLRFRGDSSLFVAGTVDIQAETFSVSDDAHIEFDTGIITIGAVPGGTNGGTMAGVLHANSILFTANSAIELSGSPEVGDLNLVSGTFLLGNRDAGEDATFHLNALAQLTFDLDARSFRLGGLTGDGTLALVDTLNRPITIEVGGSDTDTTFLGTLSGGGALTKTGLGTLTLGHANTFTGKTTITRGNLLLTDADAAQSSTVTLATTGHLLFGNGLGTFHLGGLAGAGALDLQDLAAAPVDLHVGSNNVSTAYSGVLAKGGKLTKTGSGILTLSGASTFTGGTRIESGTLAVASDRALGAAGAALTFTGGTLRATKTFTTSRAIVLESGAATFEASPLQTLTLAGRISGSGDLLIGSSGTVKITGLANTNTGRIELPTTSAQVINGVIVSAPGNKGEIIVTPGATPGSIQSIDTTSANVPVNLVVKAPAAGGSVTVGSIVNNDMTLVKKIALGAGVTLGDGTDDDIPDLVVNGKVSNLQLADVSPNTVITLGKGLAYLDTYKNHPNLTLSGALGDGVVIDVTGDGNTAGGNGGGGLGKVVLDTASAASTIKTTQSIKSLTIKNGDFNGTLLLDPNHLGKNTSANVGKISIPNGKWVGPGMQVEGVVAKFLTAGLAEGSVISAGAFGAVSIKGDYAGSIVATADALVKDKKGKVLATGGIASVSIVGAFTGVISGDGAVGSVTVSGAGQFMGTLHGGSVGNVTAGSFTGTVPAGPCKTITASGSIGNITAKVGGLTDYIIAAGTDLGADRLFSGADDHYASAVAVGGKMAAVGVGAVTVKGQVKGITIAAGVDPGEAAGAFGIYGDGNDVLVTRPAGVTAKTKIGALKFDTGGTGGMAFGTTEPGTIGGALECEALTSIFLGKLKTPDVTYLSKFDTAHYLETGADPIVVRLLTAPPIN